MSDVADDITEQYATAMEEAIESATKAEAERDAALARVAELEAKYEPPRPAGNTPIRIVSGRAYLVKVCTEEGNYWEPRVAGKSGDKVAYMYGSEVYATGDRIVLFVKRQDMIEFESYEGKFEGYPRWCIELWARSNNVLPDHVTEEFEDDEPGAPYPTSQDARE